MTAASEAGSSKQVAEVRPLTLATVILAASFVVLAVLPASAQLSVLPPPSATSIGGHHFPLPPPSATSLKPHGYGGNFGHYGEGHGHGYGHRGGGYAYGYGYSPYYYIPFDAYGYDYVGGGGPDLYSGPPSDYSGPPVDPRQTLHIIVEQPPASAYRDSEADLQPSEPPQPSAHSSQNNDDVPAEQAAPGEPTILVYRDGHKQEVRNYAIMGQTVYIFDKHTQKVALADLDMAATVKANEEQGIEFIVPPSRTRAKQATVPQQSAPDTSQPNPNTLTSALR